MAERHAGDNVAIASNHKAGVKHTALCLERISPPCTSDYLPLTYCLLLLAALLAACQRSGCCRVLAFHGLHKICASIQERSNFGGKVY